jgi:hypothetical protein
MPRGRKPPVHKAPNEQRDYPSWKAKAAKELKYRHHIEATAIAERIWMQFYVHRLGPNQAADRAESAYRGVPPRDAEKSSRAHRPLTLRQVSKHTSGTWGPDHYDVINSRGRNIGRISKLQAGVPADNPWMWTITGAVVAPPLESHGMCASLDEAKIKIAETWRAWLLLRSAGLV